MLSAYSTFHSLPSNRFSASHKTGSLQSLVMMFGVKGMLELSDYFAIDRVSTFLELVIDMVTGCSETQL